MFTCVRCTVNIESADFVGCVLLGLIKSSFIMHVIVLVVVIKSYYHHYQCY